MEKSERVEAILPDKINHTPLNNLHLFYDFVYVDGKFYICEEK
jgi:hypothetical protein